MKRIYMVGLSGYTNDMAIIKVELKTELSEIEERAIMSFIESNINTNSLVGLTMHPKFWERVELINKRDERDKEYKLNK